DKVEKMDFRNIDAIGPAGSINSTAEDMLKWIELQLSFGEWEGEEFVSRENMVKMHSPQLLISGFGGGLPGIRGMSYGLGWIVYDYQGTRIVQHGGNIDGFSALMYLIPEKNIGMVILTNMNGTALPSLVARYSCDLFVEAGETDWLDFVYKDKKKEEEKEKEEDSEQKITGTKPSHKLSDYLGEYKEEGYGSLMISLETGKLAAKYNALEFGLEHKHYDVFNMKNDLLDEEELIQFHMNAKGEISALTVSLDDNVAPIRFEKVIAE
ncbi:MAG: serine hydrolase, partial [Bacteroidota bacterium]